MSDSLVPDALRSAIAPLLPLEKPLPRGGRKPIPTRQALVGIMFVLKTGTPWEHLRCEVCGCFGTTCRLGRNNGIDFERAALDAQTYPAKRGGEATGPHPTDRGKAGSNRHVITDANGIPLAVRVTAEKAPRQALCRQGLRL